MKRLTSSLFRSRPVPAAERPGPTGLRHTSRIIPVFLLVALACLSLQAGGAGARGLYIDLPSWFQRADTSGIRLLMNETFVQAEDYDASLIGVAVPFSFNSRTSAVVSMAYPVIRRSGGYKHGFADGTIGVVTRVAGDSLNANGFFLRVDIRIPIGSGSLFPFSFRSEDGGIYPDTGAGMEYRKELPFGRFRCAATYNFSGQDAGEDDPVVTDFFAGGLSLEIAAGPGTFVRLGFIGIDFKGDGYRESYLLALDHKLSRQVRLTLSGVVDAGDDSDRVFDSLLQLMLEYDFSVSGG